MLRLKVLLGWMHVQSLDVVLARPTAATASLGADPRPPSEKLIGAVVVVSVDRLTPVNGDLARPQRRSRKKIKALVKIAENASRQRLFR